MEETNTSELLKDAQLDTAPHPRLATLSLVTTPSTARPDSDVDFLPEDIAQGLNRTGDSQNSTSSLLKEYQSRIPDLPGAALGVVRINTNEEPGHKIESHFLAAYGGEKQQQALQQAINELQKNPNINVVLVPLNAEQSKPEGRILSYVDKALTANDKIESDKVHGEIFLASKFPFTVDSASAVEWFEKQWPNIQVVPSPALEIGHFHEVADWDLNLPVNDTTLATKFTKKQIAALFGLDEAKIEVKSTKEAPKFSGSAMPAEDGNVYVKGITVQKRGGEITLVIKTTAKELELDTVKNGQSVTNTSNDTPKRKR